MGINQEPCEPLDFENEFLKFIADLDGAIHRTGTETDKARTMIRYQTLFINGGYLGLRAKENLNLTWSEIIGKTEHTLFQFKTKTKRKVYFAATQIKYIEKNFQLIDPVNIHHLVLHKQDDPTSPVSTAQFNNTFKRYMKRFGFPTKHIASHTLRKTHMLYMWEKLAEKYGADRAYLTITKMLNYKSTAQAMDYIGHTQKQIKETIIRFK